MCIPRALLWFCVSNSFKFFILCSSSGQEPADTTRPSRLPEPAPARPFTISASPQPPPTYVGGPWDTLGTSAPGYIPASHKRAGDAPGPGTLWLTFGFASCLFSFSNPGLRHGARFSWEGTNHLSFFLRATPVDGAGVPRQQLPRVAACIASPAPSRDQMDVQNQHTAISIQTNIGGLFHTL